MLTIILRNDTRTWYGRRSFRVDMASRAGTMNVRHLTSGKLADYLTPLLTKILAEERLFQIADETSNPTVKKMMR